MQHLSSRTIGVTIAMMASCILLLLVGASRLHAALHYWQPLPDTTLVALPADTTIDPFADPFHYGRSGVSVYVHGDNGQLLADADVRAFSLLEDTVLPVPFDSITLSYRFRNTWVKDFEYEEIESGIAPQRYKKLSIRREGYQAQDYYLNENCVGGGERADIYLARPGERLYYDGCYGRPFIPRRDIAYVEFFWCDEHHWKFNDNLLKKLGLQVVQLYPAVEINKAGLKKGVSRSRAGTNGVVVRRIDGSLFQTAGDTILAALRDNALVRSAGMVRGMSQDRVDAYDNRLVLVFGETEDALLRNDYETVTNLLWGMGATELTTRAKYASRGGGGRILAEFDTGIGEGILEIADTLRATRLFDIIQNNEVGTLLHLYNKGESTVSKRGKKRSPSARSASPSASQMSSASTIRSEKGDRFLQVRVVGDSGEVLSDVNVVAYRTHGVAPESSIPVQYDSSRSLYLIPHTHTSEGWISASAAGRTRQVRPLSDATLMEVVDGVLTLHLYHVRREYVWSASTKYLYTSRPDLISVQYKPGAFSQAEKMLRKVGLRVVRDLELQKTGRLEGYAVGNERIPFGDIRILVAGRSDGKLFDRYTSSELRQLREDTTVMFIGHTVRLTDTYIESYGNDLFVGFDNGKPNAEVARVAEEYGCTSIPVRHGENSQYVYIFRARSGVGEGIWELADRLIALKEVGYVSSTGLGSYSGGR